MPCLRELPQDQSEVVMDVAWQKNLQEASFLLLISLNGYSGNMVSSTDILINVMSSSMSW